MSSREAEGGSSDHTRGFTTAGEQQSTDEQLLEIQRKRPKEYFAAVKAIDHDTQRIMLKVVNDDAGMAEYTTMAEKAGVSKRTIRKHAKRLEEKGLVERSNSYAPVCSFPNVEVNALVTHVLACHRFME